MVILGVVLVVGLCVAPVGWVTWDMARLNRRRRRLETHYQSAYSLLDVHELLALSHAMASGDESNGPAQESASP